MNERMRDGRLSVRVMTFNVRFDNPKDGPDNTWEMRRDAAVAVIETHAPDVVGAQEAMQHQADDLRNGLPGYEFFGRSRELSASGEFVPLLWRRDRFEAEQKGVFWLSDTPDVEGSLGWDADAPRIATWAVLKDRGTNNRAFFVANTHLDRWGALAREASAELLVTRIAERFSGLPIVLMGDMNAVEGDPPIEVFKAAMLRDSWRDTSDTSPPTIHHFGERLGGKIDFVLVDPNWKALGAEVLHDRPDGHWPSDHYPVIADLELIEA